MVPERPGRRIEWDEGAVTKVSVMKRERFWVRIFSLVGISALAYALIFETPGQLSMWGIMALALSNAILVFLGAYLVIKLYQRRQRQKR